MFQTVLFVQWTFDPIFCHRATFNSIIHLCPNYLVFFNLSVFIFLAFLYFATLKASFTLSSLFPCFCFRWLCIWKSWQGGLALKDLETGVPFSKFRSSPQRSSDTNHHHKWVVLCDREPTLYEKAGFTALGGSSLSLHTLRKKKQQDSIWGHPLS